jgi:hypothetical protein
MIHYQLRCEGGHEFDGWFRDSAGFDAQAQAGLVACPQCGSGEVHRALMTPRIPRKGDVQVEMPAAGGVMPDAVRTALHKLRDEVEKNCDYVGAEFAEEARRIHYGEAEARGIYGESTDAEAEALADEGIGFARIPWVVGNDS